MQFHQKHSAPVMEELHKWMEAQFAPPPIMRRTRVACYVRLQRINAITILISLCSTGHNPNSSFRPLRSARTPPPATAERTAPIPFPFRRPRRNPRPL